MKKIFAILLSLISVICISFAFDGCGLYLTPIELFAEGTYETDEGARIKAKLIITSITEEQFENANGKNVIKNRSNKKKNKVYYSFELFLYDDIREDYVQAEISDLCHQAGTPPNMYAGDMDCNSGNCELSHESSHYFVLHYYSAYDVGIDYGEKNDVGETGAHLRIVS